MPPCPGRRGALGVCRRAGESGRACVWVGGWVGGGRYLRVARPVTARGPTPYRGTKPPQPHLRCCRLIGGADSKIIYRHYATLYFVFAVDSSESELGILDLIQVRSRAHIVPAPAAPPPETLAASNRLPTVPRAQTPLLASADAEAGGWWLLAQVFVESLDKRFENVCELDLIFHVEKVRRNPVFFLARWARAAPR